MKQKRGKWEREKDKKRKIIEEQVEQGGAKTISRVTRKNKGRRGKIEGMRNKEEQWKWTEEGQEKYKLRNRGTKRSSRNTGRETKGKERKKTEKQNKGSRKWEAEGQGDKKQRNKRTRE
jgi:hypothetical protein